MTIQKAERISGYEIQRLPMGRIGSARTYAAFDLETGTEILRMTASGDARTISVLVEALYRRTGKRVFREQAYRCFECFRITPMQCDHILKRSTEGRDDRRYNLRGMCAACHTRRHDNPLIQPQPAIGIVLLMRNLGWEWGGETQGWIEINPKISPRTKPSSSLTSLRTVAEERSGGSA